MAEKTITLQNVYKKLTSLEKRIAKVETRIVPEVKVSKKELAELEKIRHSIRKGSFVSEKQLFLALSK